MSGRKYEAAGFTYLEEYEETNALAQICMCCRMIGQMYRF